MATHCTIKYYIEGEFPGRQAPAKPQINILLADIRPLTSFSSHFTCILWDNMEHLLIECVKKQPLLWKTDMEEYKMCDVRDEAWKKVIEESGIKTDGEMHVKWSVSCTSSFEENHLSYVKEAKYLWKKLRDIHRQAVTRKLRDKGSKKWKHEDQMEFLLPYLKRQYYDNLNVSGVLDFIQDDTELELQDDASGSTTQKQPRKTENVFVSEFNRGNSSLDGYNMSRNPVFDDRRVVDISPRPALESFFTSMCEMTSALPETIQIRIERKIFDVVMEAREEHLQNQMTFFTS